MAKKIIGIEIGSDTLKIAASSNGVITDMVCRRLRNGSVTDGRISSPDDMSAIIKETLKENMIRGNICALVLPPQFVMGRSVTMPVMSDEELVLNLPFELKDFTGKDGDKYYYDYAIKSVKDNVMELYACAVLKSDIDSYYSLFRRAGLNMKVAVPPEIAWLNLVRTAQNEPKNLCIVDIGHTCTNVDIYANGGYVMGKEIELAGSALDQTLGKLLNMDAFAARVRKEANMDNCLSLDGCVDIYYDIATEVTRTLKFYNDTHADARVRDIYYCGGSSQIEAIRTAIIKSTDMVPHHIARLVPGADDKNDMALCCAIAAGAAIQL